MYEFKIYKKIIICKDDYNSLKKEKNRHHPIKQLYKRDSCGFSKTKFVKKVNFIIINFIITIECDN